MFFTRPKEKAKKTISQIPLAKQREPVPAKTKQSAERQWERKALAQLRGDHAALERLLNAKAKKVPRASREYLLQLIYEDHVRDQR